MTAEQEFAAAIYVLYAVECTHWLRPGEAALTRRLSGGWKLHVFREDSFTLLGRMPIWVNPIDLRPSYVSSVPERLNEEQPFTDDLVLRNATGTQLLTALSFLGAANLLILLPSLLLSGFLGAWWQLVLWITLSTQICVGIEFFERGKAWRKMKPAEFWQAFIPNFLNPIGALRSSDMLLSALFTVTPQPSRDRPHLRGEDVKRETSPQRQ